MASQNDQILLYTVAFAHWVQVAFSGRILLQRTGLLLGVRLLLLYLNPRRGGLDFATATE